MNEFNNMTIMAALELIESFNSHAKLEALEIEWNILDRCRTESKSARIADMARIAINENPDVLTSNGKMKMARAIIEKALTASSSKREGATWKKLLAGLKMDGFDLNEGEQETIPSTPWAKEEAITPLTLRRMLPADVPDLNFHEAENEVFQLLNRYEMATSKGHLEQAIAAFSRGDWAAANSQFRTFFESYLDEIAMAFGCKQSESSKNKRDYLGQLTPPFFLSSLNEWNKNNQKPQYIQGLMSRMHPEGSHAGLSDEDDCTFRMQITLITARLYLRRYDQCSRIKQNEDEIPF